MRRLALVFSLLLAGAGLLLAGALPASAALTALAPSSVTLVSSLNPSLAGQNVTFTATVSPGGIAAIPQGSIVFSINGTAVVPAVTLNAAGAPAVYTAAMPGAGRFTIVAVYSGDATFTGSTSNTVAQVVNGATASPSPSMSPSMTPSMMPTATPVPSSTVIPVGGVVTGGGGTASGESGAILIAAGGVLLLAGAGTGAYAIRRRRHGRS
jgi:Big-like domain-containing protein